MIYKLQKKGTYVIASLILFSIAISIFEEKYFWVLFGLISLICWLFLQLSWGYQIDEKGVYSHHSFKGKILIKHSFIKWEDVKKVLMGGGQRVHVYPELQPGYKFKDYIMINQNTERYKELVQTIVDKAKNAEVENTVKVWLKSKEN